MPKLINHRVDFFDAVLGKAVNIVRNCTFELKRCLTFPEDVEEAQQDYEDYFASVLMPIIYLF